jgi:hypothetical protein
MKLALYFLLPGLTFGLYQIFQDTLYFMATHI